MVETPNNTTSEKLQSTKSDGRRPQAPLPEETEARTNLPKYVELRGNGGNYDGSQFAPERRGALDGPDGDDDVIRAGRQVGTSVSTSASACSPLSTPSLSTRSHRRHPASGADAPTLSEELSLFPSPGDESGSGNTAATGAATLSITIDTGDSSNSSMMRTNQTSISSASDEAETGKHHTLANLSCRSEYITDEKRAIASPGPAESRATPPVEGGVESTAKCSPRHASGRTIASAACREYTSDDDASNRSPDWMDSTRTDAIVERSMNSSGNDMSKVIKDAARRILQAGANAPVEVETSRLNHQAPPGRLQPSSSTPVRKDASRETAGWQPEDLSDRGRHAMPGKVESAVSASDNEWKRAVAPGGKSYYYNRRTRETKWKLPTGAKLVPPSSSSKRNHFVQEEQQVAQMNQRDEVEKSPPPEDQMQLHRQQLSCHRHAGDQSRLNRRIKSMELTCCEGTSVSSRKHQGQHRAPIRTIELSHDHCDATRANSRRIHAFNRCNNLDVRDVETEYDEGCSIPSPLSLPSNLCVEGNENKPRSGKNTVVSPWNNYEENDLTYLSCRTPTNQAVRNARFSERKPSSAFRTSRGKIERQCSPRDIFAAHRQRQEDAKIASSRNAVFCLYCGIGLLVSNLREHVRKCPRFQQIRMTKSSIHRSIEKSLLEAWGSQHDVPPLPRSQQIEGGSHDETSKIGAGEMDICLDCGQGFSPGSIAFHVCGEVLSDKMSQRIRCGTPFSSMQCYPVQKTPGSTPKPEASILTMALEDFEEDSMKSTCPFCDRAFIKEGLSRHLLKCQQRRKARERREASAEKSSKRTPMSALSLSATGRQLPGHPKLRT